MLTRWWRPCGSTFFTRVVRDRGGNSTEKTVGFITAILPHDGWPAVDYSRSRPEPANRTDVR